MGVSLQTDHLIGTSAHAPQHPMVMYIGMGTVGPGPHGLLSYCLNFRNSFNAKTLKTKEPVYQLAGNQRRSYRRINDTGPPSYRGPNMLLLLWRGRAFGDEPHNILDHGQVTRTTPERASSLLASTPMRTLEPQQI
ncbi:hypothetical protein TNCV_500961 [Trichonephila clavipes]|nr:hypothetical protein TNCV_500961 [Trichonephila clavipes]